MTRDERPGQILIVDDVPRNIAVLGTMLREAGYGLFVARNGRECVEVAQRVLPDLILLDVMMPEMDGFTAAGQLKADPKTAEIPIIFLTARTEPDDIVHGFEIGGVDYITKPFHQQELLVRVANHLALRRAQLRLADLALQLGRFLSPQVYDTLFRGERQAVPGAAKRALTVVFCDIVGFTTRSEELDEAELSAWLNGFLDSMANTVLEHGGTVDKFIGDAVMAFFGDPQSRGAEQDALAAVRMAAAMVRKARVMGIAIRVGVNSGLAFVGNFGSSERMDYTAVGRVVNVASRLEHASESGRVLIGEETHALLGQQVPCTLRGGIHVKGIARELETWWVDVQDQPAPWEQP